MTTDTTRGIVPAIEESIGSMLFRTLMDEVMNVRIPWSLLPQQQQQEMLDRVRAQVDDAVALAVKRFATGGFRFIAGSIDSFASKKEVKVVLSLPRGVEELHELLDRVGTNAVLVFADPKEFSEGMDQLKAMADQPPLPLGED